MKRILLVALLFSDTAQAQIPTTDLADITATAIQHAQTLLKWKDQIDEMRSQYNKLKNTHDALTGVRNLGDIFDDPKLRKYMPADWRKAYSALKTAGYEGLLREGIEIYNDNKVHDACAHHKMVDQRLNCEAMAVQAAQTQGDLISVFKLIDERSEQLKSLQEKINETTDPKSIAELQARIASEQATIANEATRLEVLARITSAEDRMLQQRQNEFQARTFERTKGVTIEPLTFER